jgi:hypothetical protein
MKNLKILSLFTLFVSAIISSCSPDSTNEIIDETTNNNLLEKSSNKLMWDPELVAITHNNGLDYIYTQLDETPISDQKQTNLFYGNKSLEFVLQNGLDSKYDENVPDKFIDDDIRDFENSLSTNHSQSFSYEYYFLKDLMLDSKKDIDTKIQELSNYEPTKKLRDDYEYTMIITMAKVGKSSLEYWKSKGDAWQTALGNNTAKRDGDFNWSIIGFSDAAGAVGTAAGMVVNGSAAAMIAAAGPGGAVGVGLCIAAGGIMSSATAFTGQAIFGGWFD